MALELAELPTEDIRTDLKLPLLSRPENGFSKDRIDNEYNNQALPSFKPLKSVSIEYKLSQYSDQTENINYDDAIIQAFEYYSRTRDLEWFSSDSAQRDQNPKHGSSLRAKYLEDKVVKPMAAGTGIETRVVVMNKGKEPEAFVTPDGTIFVSQSLLNKLDSIDEVAAILGHEVGHLLNRTFERQASADDGKGLGIGWLHEMASDAYAKPLLEKAGFSTMAFSYAIEKISDKGRDTIHQTGLARASQSVGTHALIDFTTSGQSFTPKDRIVEGEARKSNLDIAYEAVDQFNRGLFERVAPNLHKEDLEKVYQYLKHQGTSTKKDYQVNAQTRNVRIEKLTSMFKYTNDIFRQRLEQTGQYSASEIKLFILMFQEGGGTFIDDRNVLRDQSLIKTPDELMELVSITKGFDETAKFSGMANFVAGRGKYESDSKGRLLALICRDLYDFDTGLGPGIPVNRETLIGAISQLENDLREKYSRVDPYLRNIVSDAMMKYVATTFLNYASDGGLPVERDQVLDFFQEAKDAGIEVTDSLMLFEDLVKMRLGEGVVDLTPDKEELYLDNLKTATDAFLEVFRGEVDSGLTFEAIDRFIDQFNSLGPVGDQARSFSNFMLDARSKLDRDEIPDSERLKFVEYLDKKIQGLSFTSNFNIRAYLEGQIGEGDFWGSGFLEDHKEFQQDNEPFNKFNLRTLMATYLFKDDGDEFYSYVEKLMNESAIDRSKLSKNALINLCQGYLTLDRPSLKNRFIYYGWFSPASESTLSRTTKISDFSRFLNLPFIKELLSRDESFQATDLEDLLDKAFDQRKKLIDFPPGIYEDNLSSIIQGENIRSEFIRILGKDQDELVGYDYFKLYRFVKTYYPETPQRRQYLSEISKKYLSDPDVSIAQKTDYLLENFEELGFEGMVTVASGIEKMEGEEGYQAFREKMGPRLEQYLDGSESVTAIASAEILTSYFNDFRALFETCKDDPDSKKKSSTKFATRWSQLWSGGYNQTLKKISVDNEKRFRFRTLSDHFEYFKSLSPIQRFAIAHKALTDRDGALTSDENRRSLGKILVDSLKLKQGFLSKVVEAACRKGEGKVLAFPASNMLSSMLFRSLDTGSIDYGEVYRGDIPEEDWRVMINSSTRDAAFFGPQFMNQPDSQVAQLAKESDDNYRDTTSLLDYLLTGKVPKNGENGEVLSEIDPSIEAVIKAVEASGALGIRALQLATQFYKFSPEMEKRMSQSFDSNPGLNKLLFWENLHKKVYVDNEAEVRDLLPHIKLGDYIGGGSLQTTYRSTYTENGQERPVIIKVRNPNVDTFIREGYKTSHEVLEYVANQRRDRQSASFARSSQVLVDLSQNWCLADINDKTFLEDDDAFRPRIAEYNSQNPDVGFYAPERVFTASKVKVEDLAPGSTVNQFLNDQSVPVDQKRQVAESLAKFFVHQFKGATPIEDDGEQKFLVHSDPHIGNYIVDLSSGSPRLAVIDRSMYLKLSQEDIKVLEHLVKPGGNLNEFAYGFINLVLSDTKTRGIERTTVTAKVLASLAAEHIRQMRGGKTDKLGLLRVMLSELSSKGKEAPLRLRLMVRNIGAMHELLQKYDLKLEDYYPR